MMLGPVVAGAAAKSIGQAAAAIHFGAIVLLACPVLLWAFNRLPKARPKVACTGSLHLANRSLTLPAVGLIEQMLGRRRWR